MIRFFVALILLTSCSSNPPDVMLDASPVDAMPVDAAPVVTDGSPIPDADASTPVCEIINWSTEDLQPPFAELSAVFDDPIVVNDDGGIGIGDDALVSAAEGLIIEFQQQVTLISYTVVGGSHQVQLRRDDFYKRLPSDVDGMIAVQLDVTYIQLNGVQDSVALTTVTYEVCDSPKGVN